MTERKTWSTEEDNFIRLKVEQNDKLSDKDRFKWGDIAQLLNKHFPDSQRSGKQCRERWHNQLDPNILHQEWTLEEEKKLFQLQKKLGNKWAQIASNMKGRTDNNVKNYFYSTLRKSLRKLNTFISLNRNQLKAVKQFKESSLSKLLAVADHKFDKKINIKKVTAETQAVDIKNMLIQIIRVTVDEVKYAPTFLNLVKKLQEWNKCCKKKKGKKKQEVQIGDEEADGASGDEEEDEVEDELKQSKQFKGKHNLQKSGLSQRSGIERSRSRYNNRLKVQKKLSNVSKGQKKQISKKNGVKEVEKPKPSSKAPEIPIPQMQNRHSSRINSNNSGGSNFFDLSRSSLDLGKYQKNSSGDSMKQSSNLFKSFVLDSQPDGIHDKSGDKANDSKARLTRSSSNLGFLDMIKQVSFQRKQSQRSGYGDFLQEDDYNQFLGIKMLKKESSRRELPMVRDESFLGFGGLDQSYRFEPQIRKLRSWRKESSNFENKYEFAEENAK